jgi:hypothetical protein
VALVLALKRPPGNSCHGTLENASVYCTRRTLYHIRDVYEVCAMRVRGYCCGVVGDLARALL